MSSEPRIDQLVYNRAWNPEAGESIDVLHSTRLAYITLDSFKKADKKYYFCPNCGYPGIRSPKDRAFADDGSPAMLKHNSRYPHIQCDLKVTSKDLGKHFSNERTKQKAVEDETLIVIDSWSDGPKNGPLDKPGSYSGVVENPNSPISGDTIGRYDGERYGVTSKSQSLTRMAWNFDRFWTRCIWLPDSIEPQHIYDIVHHVSRIPSDFEGNSMLFWGRARYMVFNDLFLRIYFYHGTNEISFVIPREIADQHRWTIDYLSGRLMMVCGQIEDASDAPLFIEQDPPSQCRWQVKIEYWGQTALISPKNATIMLERFQEHWEFCPEPDVFIDGVKSKETDNEPGRQREPRTDVRNADGPDIQHGTADDTLTTGSGKVSESDSSTGENRVDAASSGAGFQAIPRETTRGLRTGNYTLARAIEEFKEGNRRRSTVRNQLQTVSKQLTDVNQSLDRLTLQQRQASGDSGNSPEADDLRRIAQEFGRLAGSK